jgi:hypothetical protein
MNNLYDDVLFLIFDQVGLRTSRLINKNIKKSMDKKFIQKMYRISNEVRKQYYHEGNKMGLYHDVTIILFDNKECIFYKNYYNKKYKVNEDCISFCYMDIYSTIQILKQRIYNGKQLNIKNVIKNNFIKNRMYLYHHNISTQKMFYMKLYINIVCLNIKEIEWIDSQDLNIYLDINKQLYKDILYYIDNIK